MKERFSDVTRIRRVAVVAAIVVALVFSAGAASASPARAGTSSPDRCRGVSPRVLRIDGNLCTASASGTVAPATSSAPSSSGGIDAEWVLLGSLVAATGAGVVLLQVHRSHRHAIV